MLMLTEKPQVAGTMRARVRMRHRGADYLVVVMKRSNVRGVKGVGDPVGTFNWANWKQEELAGYGRGRQLSIGSHEPCDGRLSCTDLWGARGEIPRAYSARRWPEEYWERSSCQVVRRLQPFISAPSGYGVTGISPASLSVCCLDNRVEGWLLR
jgi:hypothetical protein